MRKKENKSKFLFSFAIYWRTKKSKIEKVFDLFCNLLKNEKKLKTK